MPLRSDLELNNAQRKDVKSFFKNKDLYNSVFDNDERKKLFYPIESNIFYGKVDTNNNFVIYNQDFLAQVPNNAEAILACDIVVKAFTDMKQYFKRAKPYLNKNSPFYELNALSGFVSIHDSYVNYLDYFYKSFANFINFKRDKSIKTPKDFFKIFVETCEFFITSQTLPITRTGFIASTYCNPGISGLIITLASESEDDDQVKFDKYVKDLNFDFYLETARKFNFVVDKEKPWRLIFNLRAGQNTSEDGELDPLDDLFSDSPIIDCGETLREMGYLKMFGINSLEDFFNKRFYKSMIGVGYSETTELESLKIVFTQMYNTYVIPNSEFLYGKDIGKQEVKIIKNVRDPLFLEDLNKMFKEEIWIKLLLYFRALETEQKWNQTEYEDFTKKSIILYKNYGIRHCINYINYITRNIFDVDKTSNRVVKREDVINIVNSEPEGFRFIGV